MSKITKKRPSTAEDQSEPKKQKGRYEVDEGDEQNDKSSAKESKNSKRTNNSNRDIDRESVQSDNASAGSESEHESGKKIKAKKTVMNLPRNARKHTKKYIQYQQRKEEKRKLEVEAIVGHTAYNKGCRKYRIKWKGDHKDTWETSHFVRDKCIDLLRDYNKQLESESSVQAILEHQRANKKHLRYLIKWRDESKGETWEGQKKVKKLCPKILHAYTLKTRAEVVVEDILKHKLVNGFSKYLIKWKDESRTWETARSTIELCPEILDKFTKKNPKCHPIIFDAIKYPVHGSDLLKTTKITEGRKNHENKEWEVARIVDSRISEDGSREFLIQWKGYRSKDNSWEAEELLNCPDLIEKYLSDAGKAKNALQREKRPLRKQTDHHADQAGDYISSKRRNIKQRADIDTDAND